MVENLFGRAVGIGLKQVECHDNHGWDTTQAVKDFIARF